MIRKVAADLLPGDLVDLERDPIADPHHSNPLFAFMYAAVFSVDLDPEGDVLVDLGVHGTCRFPPLHLLEVSENVGDPELADVA